MRASRVSFFMPFFVLKEKSKERTRPSLFPIEGERRSRTGAPSVASAAPPQERCLAFEDRDGYGAGAEKLFRTRDAWLAEERNRADHNE